MGHFFFWRFLALLCFEFFFSELHIKFEFIFTHFVYLSAAVLDHPICFYTIIILVTPLGELAFGCVEFKMMISFKMAKRPVDVFT